MDYQSLLDGIVASPDAAKVLLDSGKLPISEKEQIVQGMIKHGNGAWVAHYIRSLFPKTGSSYKAIQAYMLDNFKQVLTNSLIHYYDVAWIYRICSEDAGSINKAHLCRLMCCTLGFVYKGLSHDRVKNILDNTTSALLPLSELLKEPEFADVLNHENADKRTLPSSFLNVKDGMEFAKRLEAKPRTTPAEAAKTLIDYPEIVAQCIDTMTEAAQCQEAQEEQIPF